MDLGQVFIGGISIAPLVVGLVALAKYLGMPVKYAPMVNGVLSAALVTLAVYVLPMYPQITDAVTATVVIIITFLTASGIHQFGKTSQ